MLHRQRSEPNTADAISTHVEDFNISNSNPCDSSNFTISETRNLLSSSYGTMLSIEEEIESIEDGFYHKRTVCILGLGNVADAVEILAMSYMLNEYEKEQGDLTPWESSMLTAAVFAGMFVGGIGCGIASDRFGRRPVLLTALFINALAAIFAALSPSTNWLICFRVMAGIGVGATVPAMFSMCAEQMPSSRRGVYITILGSFWMVGSVFIAGLAWIMLGKTLSGTRIMDISWRWFAVAVSVPSFLCVVLVYYLVPESAKFLLTMGRCEEARKTLAYIYKVNQTDRRNNFQNFPQINEIEAHIDTNFERRLTDEESWFTKVIALFRCPSARITAILLFAAYCLSFGSYGLATWITKLFTQIGLSNPYANAFLYAAANLPGNIASAYLVDMIGRRKLLFGSMTLAGLSSLVFAFNLDGGSAPLIVSAACAFNAFSTASWNALNCYSAEAFPTSTRSTGLALMACFGRIGAICAQFVNGFLITRVFTLLIVTATTMTLGGASVLFDQRRHTDLQPSNTIVHIH